MFELFIPFSIEKEEVKDLVNEKDGNFSYMDQI